MYILCCLKSWGKIRGGPAPEEEPSSSSVKKPTYYTGSGYRLGSEDEPSTLAQPSSPIAPAVVQDNEPVCYRMCRHRFNISNWGI